MSHPKDYFSRQSSDYAAARPRYPDTLFEYLATLCPAHELAWDAATGNGQAAQALSAYFHRVYATDISAEQLGRAAPGHNIEYRKEETEACSLGDAGTDLITVATAAHWFRLDAFYAQVNRVLKPGGVLAIWSYAGCTINAALDPVLDEFAFHTLDPYWPPETRYNWKEKYSTLPFPYPLLETPRFFAEADYTFPELLRYIHSWSAVQQYLTAHQQDPVALVYDTLLRLWGNPEEIKTIRWELFMKCGKRAG